MNGKSCERRDVQTPSHLLIGCFEPMTSRPVAIGLKIRGHIYVQNYLEFLTNATPPAGAFEQPRDIKFIDRPHSDQTHAAQ